MLRRAQLFDRLGVRTGVFQAPMAGGPSTPAMAAATIKAGGLGGIAVAGINDPNVLHTSLGLIKEQLAAAGVGATPSNGEPRFPVQINFFTPNQYISNIGGGEERLVPSVDPSLFNKVTEVFYGSGAHSHWAGLHTDSLNGAVPSAPVQPDVATSYRRSEQGYSTMFEAALQAKPAAMSFVFGPPTPEEAAKVKAKGIVLMATATSLFEAQQLAQVGIECIIVQGAEAGGHRSTFQAPETDREATEQIALALSTVELVGMIRDEMPDVPIVAAGGIFDKSTVTAVMEAGADAVQVGTALLLSAESGCSPAYRTALKTWGPSPGDGGGAPQRLTEFTRAFSGRWARGLRNKVIEEAETRIAVNREESSTCALPFPLQNDLTAPLRKAANGLPKDTDLSKLLEGAEYLSLWAGTNVGKSVAKFPETVSTEEIVNLLGATVDEYKEANPAVE